MVAISPDDGGAIDLRDPAKAALLSWLVPGLGQVYQGRRLKGWLFMAAIGGALCAGLWIGGGRVTYFQWKPGARRVEFIGQAGIGAVAIPALVQSLWLSTTGRPLVPGGWCAPPIGDVAGDQLAAWYLQLGRYFDVGTLYTTIAGLLNMLVVYDAWAGPLHDPQPAAPTEESPQDSPRRRRKERGR